MQLRLLLHPVISPFHTERSRFVFKNKIVIEASTAFDGERCILIIEIIFIINRVGWILQKYFVTGGEQNFLFKVLQLTLFVFIAGYKGVRFGSRLGTWCCIPVLHYYNPMSPRPIWGQNSSHLQWQEPQIVRGEAVCHSCRFQ